MIKTILKNILPSSMLLKLRSISNRGKFDEVEIIYHAIREVNSSKVMLDVGACQGSSLYKFARDGWQVFAFEPDNQNRYELKRRFKSFPSVTIDPRAVSDKDQSDCPFYQSDVSAVYIALSER